MLEALSVPSVKKVVFDIGAGDARLQSLSDLGLEWIGFDRESWGKVIKWDLADRCPVPLVCADIILLLDVIEHLPNPGLALTNIAEAMKEGGTLIITTPNPCWSGSRINNLLRGQLSGFSKQDLDENHHVFPVWPHVLERFLGEAGFVPKSYVTLDGHTSLFEAKGKLRGALRFALNMVQILIELMDRTACGMSYSCVAEKRHAVASNYSYP